MSFLNLRSLTPHEKKEKEQISVTFGYVSNDTVSGDLMFTEIKFSGLLIPNVTV